jgi:hypothetical protein
MIFRSFQYSLDGVLANPFNPGAAPDAVSFSQTSEDFHNILFRESQAKKNRIPPFGKATITGFTAKKTDFLRSKSSASSYIAGAAYPIILAFRIGAKVLRKIQFHKIPFLMVNLAFKYNH